MAHHHEGERHHGRDPPLTLDALKRSLHQLGGRTSPALAAASNCSLSLLFVSITRAAVHLSVLSASHAASSEPSIRDCADRSNFENGMYPSILKEHMGCLPHMHVSIEEARARHKDYSDMRPRRASGGFAINLDAVR